MKVLIPSSDSSLKMNTIKVLLKKYKKIEIISIESVKNYSLHK